MKPAAFAYARPSSLEEATALLTEHGGDAQVLAGGQSLLPMLNLRLARPRVLVDIGRLSELRTVGWDGGALRVGATTSQRALECHGDVDRLSVLRSAIGHMGSVATRNFGTIGGAIALADPVAELPVSLVTLGGTVTARSERGVRQIAGRELYRSYYTTVLEPDEILTDVAFPALAPGQAAAFDEITVRHWGDPTLVVAMATATLTDGRCSQVDVGLGGVADTPLLVSAAAGSVLGGVDPSDAALDAAAQAVADSLDPSSDVHASAEHRRRLARHLTRRVLEAAFTQVRQEVPA